MLNRNHVMASLFLYIPTICLFIFLTSFFPIFSRAIVTDTEIRSVVQIIELQIGEDRVLPLGSGSGTIIDQRGYILTNYHVVQNVVNYSDVAPVVCFTPSVREASECFNVIAEIVDYNSFYDLALLKIIKIYDEATKTFLERDVWLDRYNLALINVSIDRNAGDERVELGDEVQVLGYPGAGGASITLTKGIVSGFESIKTAEGTILPYQIKTDAKINSGNSGGAAFDAMNRFIGVPTAVSGGQGNIGYIISLPVINYFLNEYPDIGLARTPACYGLVNGYLGSDGLCYCNVGYVWSAGQSQCIQDASIVAPPISCPIGQRLYSNECISNNDFCTRLSGTEAVWNEEKQLCVVVQQTPPPSSISAQCRMIASAALVKAPSRLLGYILLQVQSRGEAWYIPPNLGQRFYLKDGEAAYQIMRLSGLGISEVDFQKIQSGDVALKSRLKGRIVLRVNANGEAYYIHPKNLSVQYLKDGNEAYRVMRFNSLGISNSELEKIPSGEIICE